MANFQYQYPRRTKIVATIGPACASPDGIRALLRAGMDVARINMSHGDHQLHAKNIALLRTQAQQLGRNVGILLDLQGPKIRIGKFSGPGIQVRQGDTITLAVNRPCEPGELPCDYLFLDRDVSVGHALLINDGSIETSVVEVKPGTVRCLIGNDGIIEQRKGINLPQSHVSAPAITEQDIQDTHFAAAQHVDMIALSFVRKAEDVLELRQLLAQLGSDIPIISKIEKPQALHNLESILRASWGVMVARGDLGVELSVADVPMAQKRIIRLANQLNKPVITATQMLDSMTRQPRPTRAEASDVANAVLDGTDAVMLSQETAAGQYPTRAVETMVEIILATEHDRLQSTQINRPKSQSEEIPEAVARAGVQTAIHLGAKAIVVLTETGRMAQLVAQQRCPTPIIAFAREQAVRNRLCLIWGVTGQLLGPKGSLDERLEGLDNWLTQENIAAVGDRIVLLLGATNAPTGSTNLMIVHRVMPVDGA